MHVLIAPDKFKGSLSATQITGIFAEELGKIPNVKVVQCPLADGGDGTAEILTRANKGRMHQAEVLDPLLRPVQAFFGFDPLHLIAYIEMAAASGITLLKDNELDPLKTSTYGTGQLLKKAIELGADKIILGVGGSATNDGGIGAASALGYTFLNSSGDELRPVGSNMIQVAQIIKPNIQFPAIEVAVDVTNPFYGLTGAAHTYGPQKGATETDIETLDCGLKNLATVIENDLGISIHRLPGAGAAGGLAGGMVAFTGAIMKSGISIVMDQVAFEYKLQNADLVITGEGKFDDTSLKGKVVGEVISRCNKWSKECIIVCGQSTIKQDQAIFTLAKAAGSVNEAIRQPEMILRSLIRTHILPIVHQKMK